MLKKIVLLLIVFGCGSFYVSKKKRINQIITKDEISNSLEVKSNKFINKFLKEYDTISFIDETSSHAHSLNKTNYKRVHKYGFTPKKKNKSKGDFYFKYYEYADSLTCLSSYNKWLKNYGSMAVPIKQGTFIKEFPVIPTLSIFTSKYIIILFLDCEIHNKKIESIKNDFKEIFVDESKIEIIDSGCGGPIKWD